MSSVFGAELGVDDGVDVVGALVEEGEVRGAQHPVGRGGGGEHPTSGVVDDEHLVLPSGVSLGLSRTVASEESVMSS